MIEQIKQALDNATQGSWSVVSTTKFLTDIHADGQEHWNFVASRIEQQDAHLIANAPEWLRYLIGEVDRMTAKWAKAEAESARLQREVMKLRKELEEIADYPPFEETNNGDRFYGQMQDIARLALKEGDI